MLQCFVYAHKNSVWLYFFCKKYGMLIYVHEKNRNCLKIKQSISVAYISL